MVGFVRVTLLAVLVSWYHVVSHAQCTDTMNFVPLATARRCIDGSVPGYYIAAGSTPSNVIIWLGDSDLCAGASDCDVKCNNTKCDGIDVTPGTFDVSSDIELTVDCYYEALTCGSSLWPANTIGETLLCGDTGEDYAEFTRVFIPQCSKDWFLGTGDASDVTSPRFQGSLILADVLASISATLATATKVVWGGTRGGAIGAMNQFALIDGLTPAPVLGVFDSAWIVQVGEFGVTDFSNRDTVFSYNARLKAQSTNWLAAANLDPDCVTRWGPSNLVNCLYASEVVIGPSLAAQQMFFYDSQYDLLTMSQNGLADENKDTSFEDDVAFASNAIRFIEQYGAAVRVSLEEVNSATSNQFHFSTSCGQYGPLVPTAVELLGQTTEAVGTAGEFGFERTPTTWATLNIEGLSLKAALKIWVDSNGATTPSLGSDPVGLFSNGVRGDRCGSFLCNPTCSSQILPFAVVTFLPESINAFVIFIAAGVLGAGWVIFGLVFLQVRTFRFMTSGKLHKGKDSAEFNLQAELDSMDFQRKLVALTVSDVSYWVQPRTPASLTPWKKDEKNTPPEKQILYNVNLALLPGELHALMGPSGSGKTTMLDVLSNTRNVGRMVGTHTINGVPSHLSKARFLREWLRHNLGYVRQTDVLFPRLTLREHLTHAAWLMLPERMKTKEKKNRIWLVTRLLQLHDKLDVICGDGGVRFEGGLSGGQRRRVSVATQLLKFPAALVLDEPTSGLDSTNALVLISALRSIAASAKMNIFLTIHQPRREIFEQLNRLTILVNGRVAFSGTPQQCAKFFRLDPREVNIGDDILDILQGYQVDEQKLEELFSVYERSEFGRKVQQMLAEEASNLSRKETSMLRVFLNKKARKEGRKSWNKAISNLTSLKVLMSRTLRRGGFDVLRSGLISGVAGAVIGAVFLGTETYTGKTALAYLVVSAATFISFTFIGNRYKSEKIMWEHERESGTEIAWKTLLLSQFVRNIVSGCIEGFAFGSAAYWVGGLNPDFDRYLIAITLIVLVSVTVIAQNTAVDILLIRKGARMEDRLAILINMTLLCVGVLFNGFIIPLEDLPVYYQWTSYILITFWGFVGVLVNNFRDFEFPCSLSALECATRTGNNSVIRFYGYQNFDVYVCIVVLVIFLLFFKIISTLFFYFRYVRVRAKMERKGGRGEQGEGMGRTMRLLLNDEDFTNIDYDESATMEGIQGSYSPRQTNPMYRSNKNPFVSGGPPKSATRPARPKRVDISMDDV